MRELLVVRQLPVELRNRDGNDNAPGDRQEYHAAEELGDYAIKDRQYSDAPEPTQCPIFRKQSRRRLFANCGRLN